MNTKPPLSYPGISLPSAGLAGLLIAGEWRRPAAGKTLAVVNPCRLDTLAVVGAADAQDVNSAVAAAQAAFPAWKRKAARERGALLHALAQRIADHAEEFARLLAAETGNALRTQARPEVNGAIDLLRYFGSAVGEQKGETLPLGPGVFSYTTREPLGVVGAIIPWNAPLQLAAVKMGMALGTGNTLVLKPAEDAPLCVLRVAELAADVFPAGVFNVIVGDGPGAGAPLAAHPDVAKVSFTGSHEVGRAVGHAVVDRIGHVTLELGGKAPCIVFPDAPVDTTVAQVIAAMRFARQGQSCSAGSRLFLHASLWDSFMPKLAAALQALKVGDALDEANDIGALINAERYNSVCAYMREAIAAGAKLETGQLPAPAEEAGGYFAAPVVFSGVDNGWRIAREEVFGPVLVAIPWSEEAEVIRMANDTHYGLAAYVFTQDLSTALRVTEQLDAGWIQVNRAGGPLPGMSYGGFKQSGVGSEYSIEGALEGYTQRKSVTVGI